MKKTAKDAKEFGLNVDKWAKKFNVATDQLVTAIALRAFENIVRRTPVGDPDLWQSGAPKGYVGGTARNNWFLSIGQRDTTEKNAKPDSGGNEAFASLTALAGGRDPKAVIWLNNNLPYIRRLEYGWSTQAPAGMVRVTLAEIQAFYKQDVEKVKADNGL